MKKLAQPFLFALLCSLSFVLFAEEIQPKHLEQIIALQRRADKLAFGDIGSNNYHLAKARAWLDMATSEYHQVDTSGVMFEAITQAKTLLTALENKQADISVDTPGDFSGTEKVRLDLWNKIAAIKSKTNYACGQRQLAESEVQLVWAGHEKVESGWTHAEAYARITEDLISEAQVAINICNAPTAAVPVVIPPVSSTSIIVDPVVAAAPAALAPTLPTPALTPAPAATLGKITLSGDALFALNKSILNPAAIPSLDNLAKRIKQVASYDKILLVGHTDRLRTDAHHERNQKLSEDRAETVKQYLIGKGIAADKIQSSGAGATQPIVQCDYKKTNKNKSKLVSCLQPNRRVEIIFQGVK